MDTKRVDLNLLVALEALLAEQNVTKAAARLHLSQPAMSAQLARLRELFGDALLTPARRGMVPTAKALELREPLRMALDHARAVVGDHRVFEPAAASLTVSVACSDYLQTAIVKPLLRPLGARAPGIRLALRNMSPADLELQMTLGDVDIGLLDLASAPPGLRARRLYSEDWVLVARRNHPRLQDRPSLNDFLNSSSSSYHWPEADSIRLWTTLSQRAACSAMSCCRPRRSCLPWMSSLMATSSH